MTSASALPSNLGLWDVLKPTAACHEAILQSDCFQDTGSQAALVPSSSLAEVFHQIPPHSNVLQQDLCSLDYRSRLPNA